MKAYFLFVLLLFYFSGYSRQVLGTRPSQTFQSELTDFAIEVDKNQWNRKARYDTVFKDYEKVFFVSKSVIKDKNKVDSIFESAKYYLLDAIKGGYHRIIITITQKGILPRYRERVFYCDLLYEQLTGKKLYSQ